jgi:hypothetical protein
MDTDCRVPVVRKYNNYLYYRQHIHLYNERYKEKREREKKEELDRKYYYNYWKNCEWKK